MRVLLLRLEAPLMALGGPMVDQRGPTRRFPGLAMLTGLLANALGYDHAEAGRLNALQPRLIFAAAALRPGHVVADYQTVDLGLPHMLDARGWTTRGYIEERGKGSATKETHIRYRQHLADALLLVALRLDSPDEAPGLDALADALARPARPLFLGRKPCLPASPLLVGELETPFEAAGLLDALDVGMRALARDGLTWQGWSREVRVELPHDEGYEGSDAEALVDGRDWANQIHVGERLVRQTTLCWPEGAA